MSNFLNLVKNEANKMKKKIKSVFTDYKSKYIYL